ncbi:hypothetical protein [Methylobacterium sp. CM6244]
MVLVQGGPGTGKSHLVNWLKLRFDAAATTNEAGLGTALPVLVQRRSGSLRDALEQVVAQLPEAYQSYLDPVRNAIERITEAEARQKLAGAMHLELGVRWSDERRAKELPRDLRHLPEAFRSEGFATWLCRNGGAVDRSIQRLTDPSDVRDREEAPAFGPEDFIVGDVRLRAVDRNSRNVVNLIDSLLDDPSYPPQAAEICNGVLRSALSEVTGLGDAKLAQIFNRIRAELKAEGRRLAVFIEDVSTLSVLDREVVNAFEPQNDAGLCPLTSVIGMTEGVFDALPANQKQRAYMILSLGNAQTTTWRDDGDEIDRFVARYLNTARLAEPSVTAVAVARRQPGTDVPLSACSECPVQRECHQTFGAVDLSERGEEKRAEGPVMVGLFPFAPAVAHRLLSNLDDLGGARVEKTPRGLLDFVVDPVLRAIDTLDASLPARPNLPLKVHEPVYWTGFRQTYTGGWAGDEVARLKLLAEAWVSADTAGEAAGRLQPFLGPFRLPAFTAKVATPPPPRKKTEPNSVEPAALTVEPRIAALASKLEGWLGRGEVLQAPQEAQRLLLNLVRGAVPFEEARTPPARARAAVVVDNIRIIDIDGMAGRAATRSFFVTFPRSEETRDLLVALAHFEYQGRKSWDFEPDAEIHKRTVARWLRRNQGRVLASIDPPDLDIGAPVAAALRLLSVAAVVERGSDLPKDTPAALEALLQTSDLPVPRPLSSELGRLYNDLRERRRLAREFLFEELDIPQGGGRCNFIDPWPVVEALPRLREAATVESLPAGYHGGHWQTRYVGLNGLKNWEGLGAALAAERSALEDCLGDIQRGLALEGYLANGTIGGLSVAYLTFFRDVGVLLQAQKATRQVLPSPEFDRLFREDLALKDSLLPNNGMVGTTLPDDSTGATSMPGRLAASNRKATLAAAVRQAEALVAAEVDRTILTFDAEVLADARHALKVTSGYLLAVRRAVEAKLKSIAATGDPDELLDRLKRGLDDLAAVATPAVAAEAEMDEPESDEDVEAA